MSGPLEERRRSERAPRGLRPSSRREERGKPPVEDGQRDHREEQGEKLAIDPGLNWKKVETIELREKRSPGRKKLTYCCFS